MKAIIIFIGLACFGTTFAQDVNSLLTKVHDAYNGKNVQYTTLYELFKGHKSNEVHSSYSGEVVSFNGDVYQKIDKTEAVYTKDFTLKINLEDHEMMISPGQKMESTELDLDLTLKDCSSSEVIDKGSFYRIVFRIKATSSLQCSVIKLEIEKSNFTIKQIDIYYSFLQDFSENFSTQDMQQPHLRIKFSNVNLNASTKPGLFSQTTYYSIVNSIPKATGKYASYTVYDNR